MRKLFINSLAGLAIAFTTTSTVSAQSRAVVPGTGVELTQVGDDFEDPAWSYVPNNPKSTEDIDKQQRQPIGRSTNGRWYEGIKRGHPDIVKRVETPPGGLPGSEGSLLMQSLYTGIPNRPSYTMHQEDFICNVQYRLGGAISASQSPSVTTRVFLPPIAEWEKRSGPHFAFRVALEAEAPKKPFFNFGPEKEGDDGVYWPGMFIVLDRQQDTKLPHDSAYLRVRANRNGGDFKGIPITTTGWWTLGISVTPDGMVHYYAKPGVDDLTQEDYITSQFPYGRQAQRLRSFFFNVVNGDDGKNWTTPWIVDDSKVYVAQGGHMAAGASKSQRR
jgi:hypothetical protein